MGDFISREEAIEGICKSTAYKIADTASKLELIIAIGRTPTADVRPVVRGTWLSYPMLDDMCYQHYSCSVCKRVEAIPHGYNVKKELPFCHCGADMREVKADG